jgi:DNA gyrase subunit B
MSFRRGEPGVFADPASGPDAGRAVHAVRRAPDAPVVGKVARGVTGTRVRYWADRQIFLKDAEFDDEHSARAPDRPRFLVPGLLILMVRDERGLPGTLGADGPHEEVFHARGRHQRVRDFLATDAPVTDVWRLQGSGTFTETVPVLDDRAT